MGRGTPFTKSEKAITARSLSFPPPFFTLSQFLPSVCLTESFCMMSRCHIQLQRKTCQYCWAFFLSQHHCLTSSKTIISVFKLNRSDLNQDLTNLMENNACRDQTDIMYKLEFIALRFARRYKAVGCNYTCGKPTRISYAYQVVNVRACHSHKNVNSLSSQPAEKTEMAPRNRSF